MIQSDVQPWCATSHPSTTTGSQIAFWHGRLPLHWIMQTRAKGSCSLRSCWLKEDKIGQGHERCKHVEKTTSTLSSCCVTFLLQAPWGWHGGILRSCRDRFARGKNTPTWERGRGSNLNPAWIKPRERSFSFYSKFTQRRGAEISSLQCLTNILKSDVLMWLLTAGQQGLMQK